MDIRFLFIFIFYSSIISRVSNFKCGFIFLILFLFAHYFINFQLKHHPIIQLWCRMPDSNRQALSSVRFSYQPQLSLLPCGICGLDFLLGISAPPCNSLYTCPNLSILLARDCHQHYLLRVPRLSGVHFTD